MKNANAIQVENLPQLGWLQSYWTKMWLRGHPVFVRTCRLVAQTQNARVLFRITYLAPRSDYFSDAERSAEKFVSELIRAGSLGSSTINETQWKRGRLVTVQTLNSESEYVLRAIDSLKRLNLREFVVYETLEQYESSASLNSSDSSVSSPTDSQVA